MRFVTPTEIESVAWEGELVAPAVAMHPKGGRAVVAALGHPEIWPAARALEAEVGQKWTPPLGGADFWLLRLACTLREPAGRPALVSAEQRLFLRPRNPAASEGAAYAYSLFPERLGIEDKAQVAAKLGPELKFTSGAGASLGEIGATVEYRKVYPVIQAYGAGGPAPWWAFQAHPAHPLAGSQFVYAVVAARAGAGGVRASVELIAAVETTWAGVLRLGLPEEARAHLSFSIP